VIACPSARRLDLRDIPGRLVLRAVDQQAVPPDISASPSDGAWNAREVVTCRRLSLQPSAGASTGAAEAGPTETCTSAMVSKANSTVPVGLPPPSLVTPCGSPYGALRVLTLCRMAPALARAPEAVTVCLAGLPVEKLLVRGPVAALHVGGAARLHALAFVAWTWIEELEVDAPALHRLALHTVGRAILVGAVGRGGEGRNAAGEPPCSTALSDCNLSRPRVQVRGPNLKPRAPHVGILGP